MLELAFRKYSGAGNDFVVINGFVQPISFYDGELPALVQQACRRDGSVGADGLIVLEKSDIAPFRMRFFNPDGSFGALCGNGSRCAAQAALDEKIITSSSTDFEVLGTVNHAEIISDQRVKVFFQDPTFIKLGFKIRIGKKDFVQTNYVDLGSQHTVTFFDDLRGLSGGTIEAFEIRRFGPLMRWQPDLQPQGANANFIQIEGDEAGDYIRIRTFERGVEAETLACGTGCMSAAIVAVLSNRIPSAPVRLKTQSGEFVVVGFDVQEGRITNLSLEGSAVRGLQGTFKFDAGVIASEAKQSVGIE
jgi:diaminopimelate epimerase